MEQLSFDKLLRYGLPGGLCIVVALFVYSDLRPIVDAKEGLFGATVLFGLALLIGALIQGLHRAILYPVIVRFIHAHVAERDDLHVSAARMTCCEKWNIDRLTTVDIQTFDAVQDFRGKESEVTMWLTGWADQTHFFWACSWAVLAGMLLPLTGSSPGNNLRWALTLAVLLVLAAWSDDCRYMQYQLHRLRNPKPHALRRWSRQRRR